MTGDDHGAGGTRRAVRRLQGQSPPAAPSPTGSASGRRRTSIPSTSVAAAAAATRPGLRARAAPQHGLRELHARRRCGRLGGSAAASSDDLSASRRSAHEPHPLHRLERLGRRRRRSSARTACGSTRTTTTGRARGCRTAPACSPGRASRCGSRTPTDRSSTSTRPRRSSPTSGRDAAAASASRSTSTRCSTAPSGPGVLRRLHRQHAHRRANVPHPGAAAIVAAAQGAGRPGRLRRADARLARRPQRVVLPGRRLQRRAAALQRRARRPARTGCEAMVPASAATGALTALTRDGAPVAATTRTVKGIGYVVFPAAAGAYVATYGTPGGGSPFPAEPVPTTTPRGPGRPASASRAARRSRGPPRAPRSCATGPTSPPTGSCGSGCAARAARSAAGSTCGSAARGG